MDNNNIMLERYSLIHFFNELKNHRIIAVCAPAGYGKTVAVTQWLDRDNARAKAIFSLDEYDNNLASFCERFCAALRILQPQNQTLEETISHASFQNAPDEFALRAVAALSSRKQSVLAVDDLHLIHNKTVLQLLFVLIKRLPSNFQIVLISRHDLPQGLSDLWLKECAANINSKNLLFSNDEIKALYNRRGKQITQKQAEDIKLQTQGWAIGITAFMLSDGETSSDIYDYLDEFVRQNIWKKWDNETRDFMIHTAFLQELTPSICDSLTGLAHSDKLLKELVKKGAFITQLRKGVYRYHHLFQQFLRRMVEERGAEFLHSVLDAEGRWYLCQGDFYNAVDCFTRSKNHEGIAKCFELLAGSGSSDFALGRLLPIMKHPEFHSAAQKYPRLLFLLTWGAFAEGRADDMVRFMDEYYTKQIEVLDEYPSSAYTGLFMRIYDFRVSPRQMMNEIGEFSVAAASQPNLSISQWSVSLHMPRLHRGLKDYSELAIGNVTKNCLMMQSKIGWLLGEEATMLFQTLTAELLYEQGHLEKARNHAVEAMAQLKNHFLTESNFCAMAIYASVLNAIGEADEAAAVMQSISQMIEKDRAYHLSHNFNAFTVRRVIASGNKKAAVEWLDTQISNETMLYGIYADFTTCRAFLAVGKYDAAVILLKKILGIANMFNRPLDILEAQILLAIAYWKMKRGFQNEAIKNLEDAVLTAYPYNYIQMFVNDGDVLAAMLYKLQKSVEQRNDEDKKHIEFIKKMYSITRSIANAEPTSKSTEKPLKFTDKQKAVMHLLCQGKKQKVIAEILGIKLSSLQTHLETIYTKLRVSRVEDAIAKIYEMRLIDSEYEQ